jgi:Ca2+-binding RTX toxin-like protein
MAFINGTNGSDFLFGTDEDDFMLGRDGDDELRAGGGDDVLVGGEGNDTLAGDDWGAGEFGDDLLIGGQGDDWLAWIAGDDTMIGGEGNDNFFLHAAGAYEQVHVQGGDGVDTVFMINNASMVVNLGEGTVQTTFNGAPTSMTLRGIEHFTGQANEGVHLTGSSADNWLETGNGIDTLVGGAGRDTIFGGSGNDIYVLDAAPGESNADLLIFEKYTVETAGFDESDHLWLDSAVMTALGAAGTFGTDDERFHAGDGATAGAEEDDRVVYDTATGNLYYDADGIGGAEAQLIALVQLGDLPANLAASDITVI